MPSLFELITAPSSLIVMGIYAALMLWEWLRPARKLPRIKYWRIAGLAAFAAYFLISSYLPFVWAEQLAAWQLFDLTHLNIWAGTAVGLLVYEAGVYVWHRSMHNTNALWRSFHQMHHSAERLDVPSAFWFSPVDMVGWTALSSLCLTLIVGLSPQATVMTIYIATFLGVFQHANVRTPQWLGYVIERPESHSHHHARGVHAYNYCDLPIFDMLFGTFYNPRDFATANGFYDGASYRVLDMLRFRDVSSPPSAADDIDDDSRVVTLRR
jgi:sterol desaturase/sphingolipid hydroxylase (fatty acid hydroxylase superfamily)